MVGTACGLRSARFLSRIVISITSPAFNATLPDGAVGGAGVGVGVPVMGAPGAGPNSGGGVEGGGVREDNAIPLKPFSWGLW